MACTCVLCGTPVTLHDVVAVVGPIVTPSVFTGFSTFTHNTFKHLTIIMYWILLFLRYDLQSLKTHRMNIPSNRTRTWSSSVSRWESFSDMWCSSFSASLFLRLRYVSWQLTSPGLLLLLERAVSTATLSPELVFILEPLTRLVLPGTSPVSVLHPPVLWIANVLIFSVWRRGGRGCHLIPQGEEKDIWLGAE